MKRRTMARIVSLAFLALLSISIGCGDEANPTNPAVGALAGRITDAVTDTGIEGVSVSTRPATQTATSDAGGNFSIPGIATGTYTVFFIRGGYHGDSVAAAVAAGQTADIDRRLIDVDLVTLYRFDGDVADASGHDCDCVPHEVTFASGRIGQACAFNGSTSYTANPGLSFPYAPNTGTVSLWFNSRGTGGIASLITKSTYASNDYFTYIWLSADRRIHFNTKFGVETAGRRTAPDAFSLNAWHHLAMTADGSNTISFYLDGQPVSTSAYGLDSGYRFFDMGETWVMGKFFRQQSSGADFYSGSLDHVALFSRALTANEIQALYGAGSR